MPFVFLNGLSFLAYGMQGQYISESSIWSLRKIKVNILKQRSALSYKNNNYKLYNIYTLLNQVTCTLHIYIVTLILFLVFTCFNYKK
jgi:hypothetical protein